MFGKQNSALAPSGGKLKELFNPQNMKKKMKTAMGQAPSGGPKLKFEKPTLKKKLTAEKPKLLIARGAGKLQGSQKGY